MHGERNRTTLFTHELLSVRSIAHRNQQITTVSAEKKETVTTTSRCRFTMRSISRRWLRKLTPRLYSGRFYNRRGEHTKFHHDDGSQIVRLDDPRRFPSGAAGSKKSLSLLGRDDKALICGSHARPYARLRVHTRGFFDALSRAITYRDSRHWRTRDARLRRRGRSPFIVLLG